MAAADRRCSGVVLLLLSDVVVLYGQQTRGGSAGGGGGVKFTKLQQANQGVKPGLICYPGAALITDPSHSQTHTHARPCTRTRAAARRRGTPLSSVRHSGIALIVLELRALY